MEKENDEAKAWLQRTLVCRAKNFAMLHQPSLVTNEKAGLVGLGGSGKVKESDFKCSEWNGWIQNAK